MHGRRHPKKLGLLTTRLSQVPMLTVQLDVAAGTALETGRPISFAEATHSSAFGRYS
jgi:hypothetical protein